ncbi:hypothetical protein QBC40DRAFT_176011 [Triangularia verruculosa]|uniref:Uncharacterized protein n=1 Tax=Triangularia verruculosa TaxID=2587418 RepID=A0AAN7AUF5_9PEZI|nr:hypothetical protein QBC40DRAFT_176011 [Triangularia verruculosa]
MSLSTNTIIGLTALGSFLGGVLLASLVGLYLRRKHSRNLIESPPNPPHPSESAARIFRYVTEIEKWLLQGPEGPSDQIPINDFMGLDYVLELHVRNTYHQRPVSYSPDVLKQSLEGLGLDEWTQSQVLAMSLDVTRRHAAIRSLIARVMFAALDITNLSGPSLLPPQVMAFIRTLPPSSTSNFKNPHARVREVLDMWRRCSAALMQNHRWLLSTLEPSQDIRQQARELSQALSKYLAHFAEEPAEGRLDHGEKLYLLVEEYLNFGYLIFSSPCNWRFPFEAERKDWSEGIVVRPGLERVSGYHGEVFDDPLVRAPPLQVQ